MRMLWGVRCVCAFAKRIESVNVEKHEVGIVATEAEVGVEA